MPPNPTKNRKQAQYIKRYGFLEYGLGFVRY